MGYAAPSLAAFDEARQRFNIQVIATYPNNDAVASGRRLKRIGIAMSSTFDTFISGETVDLVVPDAQAIEDYGWHAWFNDADTTRYLEQGLYPNSREQQRHYLDGLNTPDGDRLATLIWSKSAETLVGTASLSAISWQHRSAETAVVIGDRVGRVDDLFHGLEAHARLVEHAFEVMGLERVGSGQARPLADWQRLQLLFGFRPEGIKRQAFRKGQKAYDSVLSGCTLADYRRVKKARDGNYWPGRQQLWALMRTLPRDSVVDCMADAIEEAVSSYLAEVPLAVEDKT